MKSQFRCVCALRLILAAPGTAGGDPGTPDKANFPQPLGPEVFGVRATGTLVKPILRPLLGRPPAKYGSHSPAVGGDGFPATLADVQAMTMCWKN